MNTKKSNIQEIIENYTNRYFNKISNNFSIKKNFSIAHIPFLIIMGFILFVAYIDVDFRKELIPIVKFSILVILLIVFILIFIVKKEVFIFQIFHYLNTRIINNANNIDNIVSKANHIHSIIRVITNKWFKPWILSNPTHTIDSLVEIDKIIQEELYFCIEKLLNARENIHKILEYNQRKLIEAKSSLSTHIHGTNELNQVSELQKQRLDRQIEQFEELQRVLVKI